MPTSLMNCWGKMFRPRGVIMVVPAPCANVLNSWIAIRAGPMSATSAVEYYGHKPAQIATLLCLNVNRSAFEVISNIPKPAPVS
jgi:hypothetical protein